MRIPTVLSTVLQRLATWWVVAITGGLFIASAVAMFATTLPFSIPAVTALCGTAPPDVRFFTAADQVREFLAGCGDTGRDAYRYLQLADLVYPAISGLFLTSALALILTRLSRPGSGVIALAALPIVGSAFDYLENVAAWTALTAFPQDAPVATNALGVMSIAKQAVTWTTWTVLIVALACLVVRAAQRRRATHAAGERLVAASAPEQKLPA
jgi:hypothetical protein